MARNMKRAQENYRKKFYKDPTDRASAFTVSEAEQINNETRYKGEAALYGLEAGFWLGYQYAKREAKKAAQ